MISFLHTHVMLAESRALYSNVETSLVTCKVPIDSSLTEVLGTPHILGPSQHVFTRVG